MDPNKKLHRIVGKAIVSTKFREGILGGKRAELLQPFELEAEEFGALMSIRATTLSDFARGINGILSSRGGPVIEESEMAPKRSRPESG